MTMNLVLFVASLDSPWAIAPPERGRRERSEEV